MDFKVGDLIIVNNCAGEVVGVDGKSCYFLYAEGSGKENNNKFYEKYKNRPMSEWAFRVPSFEIDNLENSGVKKMSSFAYGSRVRHEKLGEGTFWHVSKSDSTNGAVCFDDFKGTYRVPLDSLTEVQPPFPFKIGDTVKASGSYSNPGVIIDVDKKQGKFAIKYLRRTSDGDMSEENIQRMTHILPFSKAYTMNKVIS